MLGKFKGGPSTKVHRTSSLDTRAFMKETGSQLEDEYSLDKPPDRTAPPDLDKTSLIKSNNHRGRSQIPNSSTSGYSTNSTISSPPISSSDDEAGGSHDGSRTPKEPRSKSSGPTVPVKERGDRKIDKRVKSEQRAAQDSVKDKIKPILKKPSERDRESSKKRQVTTAGQVRPGQKISSDTDSSLHNQKIQLPQKVATRLDPRSQRLEGNQSSNKEIKKSAPDPGGGGGGGGGVGDKPTDEPEDEATRLQRILMSIEPGDLYHFTIARLSTHDPKIIEALNVLLPAIDVEKLASMSLTSSSSGPDDETASNSSSGRDHPTTTDNGIHTSSEEIRTTTEGPDEEVSSNCDASQSSSKIHDFEELDQDIEADKHNPHHHSPHSETKDNHSNSSTHQLPQTTSLSSTTTTAASKCTTTNNIETHSIVSSNSNSMLILKGNNNNNNTSPEVTTEAKPKVKVKHCVRCHKNYNQNNIGAEKRCMVAHPEAMVIKTSEDDSGADFKCMVCGKGFRLNVSFYEEGTSSLLTGFCYSGQHSTDPQNVEFRKLGGAAKTCEEHGCVEFYV